MQEIRIAIPCFGEEIAPCFEAAHHFLFWSYQNKEICRSGDFEAPGPADGLHRIRQLSKSRIDVLICNGISETSRNLLNAKGCKVIQGIVGPISDALYAYLAGKIIHDGTEYRLSAVTPQPRVADMVEWTLELFRHHGWEASSESRPEAFAVDIIAEKPCPVCSKPVRVAICCGAHAYRIDAEIREFQRITAASGYNLRIYVHQALPGVVAKCREYGIVLLDPESFSDSDGDANALYPLEPIRDKVAGHPHLNTLDKADRLNYNRGNQ